MAPLVAGRPANAAAAAGQVSPSWTVNTGVSGWNTPYWGHEPFAGAAAADLFGDGNQEVVTAFPNGVMDVIAGATGQVLWTVNLGAAVDTTPTLADLYGDGRREILVTTQHGYL